MIYVGRRRRRRRIIIITSFFLSPTSNLRLVTHSHTNIARIEGNWREEAKSRRIINRSIRKVFLFARLPLILAVLPPSLSLSRWSIFPFPIMIMVAVRLPYRLVGTSLSFHTCSSYLLDSITICLMAAVWPAVVASNAGRLMMICYSAMVKSSYRFLPRALTNPSTYLLLLLLTCTSNRLLVVLYCLRGLSLEFPLHNNKCFGGHQ